MLAFSQVTLPGEESGIHWGQQQHYALNFVVEGKGTLEHPQIKGKELLAPGCLYQHFPEDQGGRVLWESPEVSEIFIILDQRTWSRINEFGLFPETRLMRTPVLERVLDVMIASHDRLQHVGNSPLQEEGCRIVAEVMTLLTDIFQVMRVDVGIDRPYQEVVARVQHWMEVNPTDRRSLPSLARKMGVSYASLRNYFPEITGMALSEYRILCRIHHAQRLLADHNVQETSEQLGFADAFVFSNQFKARTGMSPREYRKTLKGEAEPRIRDKG
jgi:AraC-like DNA-binding protein